MCILVYIYIRKICLRIAYAKGSIEDIAKQ